MEWFFYGTNLASIVCLNSTTGKEQWILDMSELNPTRFKSFYSVESTPVVDYDRVYFGSPHGFLYAVDALTGNWIWHFDTEAYISSSPVISGDFVYIFTEKGCLHAINKDTGKELWKHEFKINRLSSSPIISDGVLFIGLDKMYCFETST